MEGLECLSTLTCTIAKLDCVIDPGDLPEDQLRRFGPFAVPAWLATGAHPVRAGISEAIVRRLARKHPRWNAAQLGLCALCRSMFDGFARARVLAVSGTCVAYRDHAYLFTSMSPRLARHHALLWRQYLGDAVRLLGEGWVALSETKHGRDSYIIASATPWWGSFAVSENITLPLDGWCFIAPDDSAGPVAAAVERADGSALVNDAIRSMFIPDGVQDAARSLDVLNRVMLLCPLYRARSDGAERPVARTFELMTGRSYADARVLHSWPVLEGVRAWM